MPNFKKTTRVLLTIFTLTLVACAADSSPISNAHTENSTDFNYTAPSGHEIHLSQIAFKTNGMVKLDVPEVLGLGGTTYIYTRYGAWNSRTGQTDVFALGHMPSAGITLTGDQIYYGRALRSIKQSVYDNRLTYALNFDHKSFVGFSVSPPDRNTFGSGILMRGSLHANTVSGTVDSGKDKGTFTAQFYGVNGLEFVGLAKFQNTSLNFAFGGDLQQ